MVLTNDGRRYARCDRCDYSGPVRDDWAEAFCDLAAHNKETHGPLATGESHLLAPEE